MILYKVCSTCNREKPISDFGKRKNSPDGLRGQCKKCRNKVNQAWRNDNRDAVRKSNRDFYYRNQEKFAQWRKQNRVQNAERESARSKTYYSNHKKEFRERLNRRRARLAGQGVLYVSPKDIRKLQNSPCVACGSTSNLSIDHVVPIARGGRHSIGNLQSLCMSCNMSKSTKFMIEWRMSRS